MEIFLKAVSAVVVLGLGIFVLSKDRQHAANLVFCFICVSLAGLMAGDAWWVYCAMHQMSPVAGAVLTQFFYPFIACLPVIFSWYFPWPNSGRLLLRSLLLCLVAVAFSVIGLLDKYVEQAPPESGKPFMYTPYYYLLVAYMLVCTAYVLAIMAYAICKHQALEIHTVLHKTLGWVLLSSIAILGLYALSRASQMVLAHAPEEFRAIVVSILSFLFVLAHLQFIQPHIDHLFQRRRYNAIRISEQLGRQLAELTQLGERVADILREVLYAEWATLMVAEGERFVPIIDGAARPVQQASEDGQLFLAYLRKYEEILEEGGFGSTPCPDRARHSISPCRRCRRR